MKRVTGSVEDKIIVFDYILMITAIFNALITKHWLSWSLLILILVSLGYKKKYLRS